MLGMGSVGSWSMGSVGNWSMGNLGDWSDSGGFDNSGTGTVNNSVESVDWVGSVGHGTDGTVGFNKGVLSLDSITTTAFLLSMLVTSESIRNGVSVAVLWVWVVGLSGNSSWNDIILNFGKLQSKC